MGRVGKYKVPSQFHLESFIITIEHAKIESMHEPWHLDYGTRACFYREELDNVTPGNRSEKWEFEIMQLPQHFLEPARTVPSGSPIFVHSYTKYVFDLPEYFLHGVAPRILKWTICRGWVL